MFLGVAVLFLKWASGGCWGERQLCVGSCRASQHHGWPVSVGNRLVQCSTAMSAIWETIPITQEADIQISRGNAAIRPRASDSTSFLNCPLSEKNQDETINVAIEKRRAFRGVLLELLR